MGLQPNLERPLAFRHRVCLRCGKDKNSDHFLQSKSRAAIDGYTSICRECIEEDLIKEDYNWKVLDQWCAILNIPFVPNQFEEMHFSDFPFARYSQIFFTQEYAFLNWKQYYDQFKELENRDLIDQELPRIKEEKLFRLRQKWGDNYSEEQLSYLEMLYDGILLSQNVNGALQIDQAKKLCKSSLLIDEKIREGSDYDKLLASYDKLVKIAEFTPRNAKNAADFDSTGELFHWLEKRGWKNTFYDGVTRDVVDETLKNIQNFNQKLYTSESGIGEEISRRIEALKNVAEMENYYDSKQEFDMDNYDNDGFTELLNEDFLTDLEDIDGEIN